MILTIDRYFVGDPNIVGITTTDTITTITTAGYWTSQLPVIQQLINGTFEWLPSDIVLIYYSPNLVGFFTFDATTATFVELIVPGDVSSINAIYPLLANGVSGIPQTGSVVLSIVPSWTDATSTPVQMITNTGYTADNGATLSTFKLPTISSIRDWIEINGKGSGGWILTQAAGQQITVSPTQTTAGAGGSLASAHRYDNVRLRCTTASLMWSVVSQQSAGLTIV